MTRAIELTAPIVSEVEWNLATKKTTFAGITLPNAGPELEDVYSSALMYQQEYLTKHNFKAIHGLTVDTMSKIKNKKLFIKNVKDIAPANIMTAKTGRWYILLTNNINYHQLLEIDISKSKSTGIPHTTLQSTPPNARSILQSHTNQLD